jgi:hypothetical protein
MMTGATIFMPKGIRRGAPPSAHSSSKMYCSTGLQPGPPNCFGQPGPLQPRLGQAAEAVRRASGNALTLLSMLCHYPEHDTES